MVPPRLRFWFVVHFVADIFFAIPLILAPEMLLRPLGWTVVDPVVSRVVGAALVGIGGESLLGRHADLASFRTMLRLKILWSGATIVGLILSIGQGAPWGAWLFLAIFLCFCGLWIYWAGRLGQIAASTNASAST
ncbi:MAG: hypothetical protein IPM54_18490 [Polyangiaceae bacterium]|nr:hypothetical protein [Polyangiaceae bacterium]